MKNYFRCAGLALLAWGYTLAWSQASVPISPGTAPVTALETVIITGNPLGSSDFIAPAAQYSGLELTLRSKTTLGELLDGTPGVSSSYFGPNASRPVIRGLEGDRIKILNNGGLSNDASGLSYDHAVAADPLSIERVEVLRGAAALQYGGSAVGGVVNLIDNRIPREPLFDERAGVTGKIDLGLASGNAERGGAFLLEGGNQSYALHADGFERRTGDVAVPKNLACRRAGSSPLAQRICNSASATQGGAFGGTAFFDQAYLGASVSSYQSQYGTVAEDDVTIDMKSQRYALESEVRGLTGLLQSIKAQLSRTDYSHTEYAAGVAGTVFKNSGNALKLEGRHVTLGPLQGMVGLQLDANNFSALGSEAFAPLSHTGQQALFVYEELARSWGKLSFGVRQEIVQVESLGNPQAARFLPGRRNFNPSSTAVGGLWHVAPQWQLSSNLAFTQRAPKDYELFADGPHLATGVYEIGNANFSVEKSSNLDLGVKWKNGASSASLSVFVNNFDHYIALQATGNTQDSLPEYAYSQVQARFRGLEAQSRFRLLASGQSLDLELRGDLVRADNLTADQAMPRIAPVRIGANLLWGQGPWGARLGVQQVANQTRVPPGQMETPGYTLWNTALSYQTKLGTNQLLGYARIDNLGNSLAYSASSILTQTVPGKVPLPGRSLKLGLQLSFY